MRKHSEEYLKREPGKLVQLRIRSPVGEAHATHSWEWLPWNLSRICQLNWCGWSPSLKSQALRKGHRKGIGGMLDIGTNLPSSRIPECVVLLFHKIEIIEYDLNHYAFCWVMSVSLCMWMSTAWPKPWMTASTILTIQYMEHTHRYCTFREYGYPSVSWHNRVKIACGRSSNSIVAWLLEVFVISCWDFVVHMGSPQLFLAGWKRTISNDL